MKSDLVELLRAGNIWTRQRYRPFFVDRERVGWISHSFAQTLAAFPEVLSVADDGVRFADRLVGADDRSAALEGLLRGMKNAANFGRWCDEKAAVVKAFGASPFFVIERSVMTAFGVRGFGVHLNGYVRSDHGLRLWIARRDRVRSDYGGLRDTLVGGFLAYRRGIRETLAKEAWEEAGIAPEIAARATPVGAIYNCIELPSGVCPFGIFCFDLQLPADFRPQNQDGEIEEFELADLAMLRQELLAGHVKFNTVPILVDFMIRHGLIDPSDSGYFELLRLTRNWGDE